MSQGVRYLCIGNIPITIQGGKHTIRPIRPKPLEKSNQHSIQVQAKQGFSLDSNLDHVDNCIRFLLLILFEN